MPYLRFSRTRQGYEHTYVLHTFRSEGRSRPRLLYWFRTPPGVRVGRRPLDEKAIRAIEEGNPNLTFDWSRMLKVRPAPRPEPAPRGAGSRPSGRGRRGGRTGKDAPAVTVPDAAAPAASPVDPAVSTDQGDRMESADPAASSGALAEEPAAEEELDAPDSAEPWRHPVVTLMGDEMLERLRARYAEMLVRIGEKRLDPAARAAIRAKVEALNPDGWRTVETAVHGIERFEAEADAIRRLLGRRPPRAQRGRRVMSSGGALL